MIRNEVNKKKNRSVRVDSVFLALKHDKAAVISLILLGLIILFALI
ncbi:MAG: ABC transporter permease, partial [Lacrimispora sphenoides]